jgi:hypothetical protein
MERSAEELAVAPAILQEIFAIASHLHLTPVRPLPGQAKSPADRPGFATQRYAYARYIAALLGRRRLRHKGLEGLVGLLGEVGIELANLGGLGHEALVRGLRIVGLDLDGLIQ